MNRNRRLIRWLQTGLSILFLSGLMACHGGIFGTGDGSDDGSAGVENGSSEAGDEGPGATDADSGTTGAGGSTDGGTSGTDGATDGADGTDGTDGGGTDSGQSPATQAFANESPVTERADALITIINASNQLVLTTITTGEGAAMPIPLLDSLSSSEHLSLDSDQSHTLEFFNAGIDSSVPQARLSPAQLSAATISTIVVRDSSNSLNVIPLVTSISTSDSTLAKFRFVLAADFGAVGDISVQSSGPNPGGGEHTYPNISNSNPVGNYIDLPAGDYTISDSTDRFTDLPVNLAGGSVSTYVLTRASDPILIVENDGDIELTP